MKTDNPVADAMTRDAEFEKWLQTRPICQVCGEFIQDESAVCINDEWICDGCLKEYRRYIDE